MPQSWEWGPWAQQGEDYVKAQREQEQRDRQAAQQRQLQEQTSAAALRNLLEGKRFDEQAKIAAEERQANQAVPALRSLITGNPAVARTLGYTEESMPVPEAGYAGGTITRRPSDDEMRGLAKAVPGIATTLLQKQLEKPDEYAPYQPGAGLYNKRTGEVAIPATKKPGAYASMEEALAAQDQLVAQRPELKGRVAIDQDAQGNFQIKLNPTDPMSLQDPTRVAFDRAIQAGVPFDKAYAQWKKDQGEISGIKAFNVQQNQALPPNVQETVRKVSQVIDAVDELQTSFTSADRRIFTGWFKDKAAMAALTAYEVAKFSNETFGTPMPPLGYSPEQLQKFSEFKRLNGMIEQYKFAVGGKQLTLGEQKVVDAFIPNGREATTAEYEAKLAGLRKVMRAQAAAEMWLAQQPRKDVDLETLRNVMRNALKAQGIDVSKSPDEQRMSEMSPAERLRNKYGAK